MAIRIFFVLAPLFILLIGPWPVDETPYQQTSYAKQTFTYIDQVPRIQPSSGLKAGSASVEIITPLGSPLAGYSAREPKANTGAIDKIYAKAITLSDENSTITLLSAEILLPLPELVNAIVKKTGLNRNEIYFSVTHTHSGPGGYAHGIIESTSMGQFSRQQFNNLVDSLSSAIVKSRLNLNPVSMKYTRLTLPPELADHYIRNQLATSGNTHNSIHVLELNLKNPINSPVNSAPNTKNNNSPLATLITFSAHPTFLGRINREISGDYPAIVMRQLEATLGGNVMFSVGAVGGMVPVGNSSKRLNSLEKQKTKLKFMGESMANYIANHLSSDNKQSIENISWQTESATIQSEIVPIALPFPNHSITDNLRLSPFLVNMLLHGNHSFIHTLKIGKLFFLSYPADYSGELAMSLEKWSSDKDIYPWATSFNGEYIGYLSPSKHYNSNHYTTRDMNFYGKWTGDYFLETSKKIISKLK